MSGYIGTQPVPQATQTRDSFTATSGQTTFATGGYTPNFLDVYLNGVKLASADYTATNGSDVVLASGAATGDILEVVAFTTFTPANIPSGTPSITDNGNATALTIDSSEHVMVGTAVSTGFQSSSSATGTIAYSHGSIASNTSGDAAAYFNRLVSDGDIAQFKKNGATVGSIGSAGANSYIGTGDTGIHFAADLDVLNPWNPSTNGVRDNAINLGWSAGRFKDAYLSGGIYLGGTGSANYLDDVETGTWTPTAGKSVSDPTTSYSERLGSYVKIGDLVFASFDFNITSVSGGSGGTIRLKGLPFTVSSSTNNFSGYGVAQWRSIGAIPAGAAGTQLKGYPERGQSYIGIQYDHSGSNGFGTQGNATSWQTGRATGYVIYPAQS